MSIYSNFIPTYLYIKQHSITGKLYFGKTFDARGPEKYPGSGTRWKRHIKKHGKEYVITLWFCLFHTKESIQEFAINFSKDHNIIKSDKWLNLKDENGLDGGSMKDSLSSESRLKIAKFRSDQRGSKEQNMKRSIATTGQGNGMFNKIHKESTLAKMRKPKTSTINMKGPKLLTTCPHCNKTGGAGNMTRYHFDNCKFKL